MTLSGYKRSFNLFDSEDLTIQIDLGKVDEGSQTIPLLDEHVPLPESFDVKGIDPRVARLKIDKLTSYTLKVEADLTGSVPEGIKLKGVKVDPHRVSVFSSENKDVRDMVLKTEPISLEGVTEARTVSSRIVVPPGVRHVDEEFPPIDVTITVEMEKEEKIAE